MRTLPTNLASMVAGEAIYLARICRIALADGREFFVTDHDADLTHDGDVYLSSVGFDPSSVKTAIGGQSSNFEFSLLLGSVVTNEMVETGAFDNAAVEYSIIGSRVPADGAALYFKGVVSLAKVKDAHTALFEVTPLLARDLRLADEKYSQYCTADFGDARCKFDVEGTSFAAEVTAVDNQQSFTTDSAESDGHWNFGTAVFTSGANNGVAVEVGSSLATGVIKLRLVVPFAIEIGDTLTLYRGCDKSPASCKGYDNFVNYRGFPFLANGQVFEGKTTATSTAQRAPVYILS